MIVSVGWEYSSRCGVTLGMRHRQQWHIHLYTCSTAEDSDISTQTILLCGHGAFYLYRLLNRATAALISQTNTYRDLGH